MEVHSALLLLLLVVVLVEREAETAARGWISESTRCIRNTRSPIRRTSGRAFVRWGRPKSSMDGERVFRGPVGATASFAAAFVRLVSMGGSEKDSGIPVARPVSPPLFSYTRASCAERPIRGFNWIIGRQVNCGWAGRIGMQAGEIPLMSHW